MIIDIIFYDLVSVYRYFLGQAAGFETKFPLGTGLDRSDFGFKPVVLRFLYTLIRVRCLGSTQSCCAQQAFQYARLTPANTVSIFLYGSSRTFWKEVRRIIYYDSEG